MCTSEEVSSIGKWVAPFKALFQQLCEGTEDNHKKKNI
jgi:hypothetical protein